MSALTRAVLWDLDGTLVDSEDYHWQSWRDTMAAEGVDLSHETFLKSFGQRNDRILRDWLGDAAAADRVARVGDAKEVAYRRLVADGSLEPLPGAREWISRLLIDGWRQAIASSAPRLNVDAMLRALRLEAFFDAIVSAEDVAVGKPDPAVFLAAADRLVADPARCIVVEDAPAGIEAARRAGMKSIGVSRSATLDADLFVASLSDLGPDAFAELLRRR
jgi:HAD superfamily hydrolase (TIGR01509 family)